MFMVVYADVLIALNIFVNYFLLLSVKKLMKINVKTLNIAIGALLGGIYALSIFLENVPKPLQFLMNICALSVMTLVSFRPISLKAFLKYILCLFGVNTAFAGIMLAVWLFFSPKGMLYNNSIVYFDIDIKLLAVSTLVCYAVLRVVGLFVKRASPADKTVSVSLFNSGKSITVNALIDTGNTLKDAFTGEGVVIADEAVIKSLFGCSLTAYIEKEKTGIYENKLNIRLIPVNTVSGETVLPAVKTEQMIINKTGKTKQGVLLAQSKTKISNGEYQLILNWEIMN